MQSILIVDDEEDIIELLTYHLSKQGYKIYSASNGKVALEIAKIHTPDLILLDVMMPLMDGVEACREIKLIEKLKNTFIIFLSARIEEFTQIAAYDAGADDYIIKPIKPKILISKIQALFRRNEKTTIENSEVAIEIGELKINREKYLITDKNGSHDLPRKEFELIALLASKINKVFTREEILLKVWGNDVIVGDRTIDVHIRKLRERFGNDIIKTIKGVGYKLNVS